MYKTVVFDLDGTLLDTLEDLYLSVNHALAAHSLPARSRDEVRLATGNGIALLIKRSVPADRPDELREKVFKTFKEHYGAHSMDHTAPYAGMPELVASLRAAGVRVAVVSNKADFAVQTIIRATFPDAFDCVMGEQRGRGHSQEAGPTHGRRSACGNGRQVGGRGLRGRLRGGRGHGGKRRLRLRGLFLGLPRARGPRRGRRHDHR